MAASNPEYAQELKKVQDRDFTHSWVSASGFLFYLQVTCFVVLILGTCYGLYTKRYHKAEVNIPANTLYTPQYK